MATGILQGLRVLELDGLGPVPFACRMLADMGADILRLCRPGATTPEPPGTRRGRRDLLVDLKSVEGRLLAMELAGRAEVLVEGFRPGVMERLGLGPEQLLAARPSLVYGGMTGWGPSGPWAMTAGHDINYISLSGALDAVGSSTSGPAVPLNIVGDYAGGSLHLVSGILAAVLHARQTGEGQVIDCAICDGVASMMTLDHEQMRAVRWQNGRDSNLLDGGAHFYTTYRCKDGKWLAVGAIEPQFYAELRSRAGWSAPAFDRQHDRANWQMLKERAQRIFMTRTRDEWLEIFEGSEACVTPVLTLAESADDAHMRARRTLIEHGDGLLPEPAPRFPATPSAVAPTSRTFTYDAALESWQMPPNR
jgi:alpha-methylacyl-CoA racemase